MKLFGLKTCDTCRKALKALPGVEFVDVRKDGVPDAVLTSALAEFGEALVNKKSATWRGLSDDERASEPAALLQAHPTLMKRPLITDASKMTLGWNADVEAVWA
ncbi:MAG: ArsC/Spx/MgsR family protein [Pseudomonadota bacterium]